MLNMKDCAEDFMRAIRFNKVDIDAKEMASDLSQMLEKANIPARVKAEEIKAGGLFGSVYPCVMISHPEPPQSYFDHVIIFNKDTLTFKYYGLSTAVFNHNKKAAYVQEGKLFRSAFINDDPMAYDTEFNWHRDVKDAIRYYLVGDE